MEAIADRGYYKGPEILKCVEAGITPSVPKTMTSDNKARGLYDKRDFVYADCRALGAGLNLRSGRIVAMKDTTLIVKDDELRYEWKLPYAAIEVPSTDDPAALAHEPRDEPPRPNRDDFRVGDRVGFDDRHLQTHIGTVVRINQRTASVDCDGHNWRVSFALLRHIIDL